MSAAPQHPASADAPAGLPVHSRLGRWLAGWTLLPADHYSALGLAPDAGADEIEAAHAATLARVCRSWRARVLAQCCGQSPQRLALARAELLDPVRRRAYDAHLAQLRTLLANPPH